MANPGELASSGELAGSGEFPREEAFMPKLEVEDGYLKVGIPLGMIALALRQAESRDRNGFFLVLDTSDAPVYAYTDNGAEIAPDVRFADGLCLFSEARKEFLVLGHQISMTPQHVSLMTALTRNIDRPVQYEALIGATYPRDYPNESLTKQREKVVQNRLGELRHMAGEIVPHLGDRNYGIIRWIRSAKGYVIPTEL
jgi:hypothetical protein